jgi:hypothetical protein
MPFKTRTESITLKILRILNKRMGLAEETRTYYLYLEKGYLGEDQFDSLTEKLECECLVLNDLELEIDNTKFQIDTLLIYQDLIYMIEVKNYEGDYCYDPDSFTTKSGTVLKNPLDQLKRSKTLLRQMCQKNGIQLPVEASVVFVNPAFTLYQAPKNLPFIFPTQLSRFLEKLNSKSSKLTSWHTKFADHFVSLHKNEPHRAQIPFYEYEHVKKGIICSSCNSFSLTLPIRNLRVVCSECSHKELVEEAVLRSLEEYTLLFPDRKITTRAIHDWCQVVDSTKTINRILMANFTKANNFRWTYFE